MNGKDKKIVSEAMSILGSSKSDKKKAAGRRNIAKARAAYAKTRLVKGESQRATATVKNNGK